MCDRLHYEDLDERVTNLEQVVAEMRKETSDGLKAVNSNIETLSQQMTNMDRRLVDEKAKWGEVFRSIVKWTVRAGITIIICAAGVNLTEGLLKSIAH